MADFDALDRITTIEDADRDANARAAQLAPAEPDSLFLGNLAARLLAPLLWAAATTRRGLDDVRRWVDVGATGAVPPQAQAEARTLLETLVAGGDPQKAVQARQALQRLSAATLGNETHDRRIHTTAHQMLTT